MPNANRPGRLALSKRSGAWLRRARNRLGLTQAELGKKIGISETEVARKERGERGMPRYIEARVVALLAEAGETDVGLWTRRKGS